MSLTSKRNPGDYVDGPGSSEGEATMGSFPQGVRHGMKGIIGAERAKTYTPSSYAGDKGGSAGGYGLPHGLLPHGLRHGDMGGSEPMSVNVPSGAMPSMGFEGGVRGGGDGETMPSQKVHGKKKGYDEHKSVGGSIHGVPGVEGMPHGAGGYGAADTGSANMGGHACPHGCGASMSSAHGLARHIHAKHGGFKGLGHALLTGMRGVPTTTHGDSYGNQEFRGETEGPKEWEANEHEWANAARIAAQGTSPVPSNDHASSYANGDRSGSYGRLHG